MFDIKQLSSSFTSAVSLQTLAVYIPGQTNDVYKQLIHLWVFDADTDHARINLSSLLFWTTCVATMAGCGLLSNRLFRRCDTDQPSVRKRHHRKNTSLTVTSSEDDSDESSSTPSRRMTAVDEKQSAAGYRRFSPNGTLKPIAMHHGVLTLILMSL